MTRKSTILVAGLGLLAAASIATGASAETRWEARHPRQDEVFDRIHRQDMRIREERREGDLNRWQARRLIARDARIGREDRFFSRVNGGYITKGEQRFLNRQENGTGRHIPG